MRTYIRKNIVRVLLTLAILYVIFFVDLGHGTLARQVLRVLTTPEAVALATDIYDSLVRLLVGVVRFIGSLFAAVKDNV